MEHLNLRPTWACDVPEFRDTMTGFVYHTIEVAPNELGADLGWELHDDLD